MKQKNNRVVTEKSQIRDALYDHRVWYESSSFMGSRFNMSGEYRRLNFLNEYIPHAIFEDFKAHNTKFQGANLSSAQFKHCILENVDFSGADLTLAQFHCVVFVNAKFDQNFSGIKHIQHCWFETDIFPWLLLNPHSSRLLGMNNIVEKGKMNIEDVINQFEWFKYNSRHQQFS
jgi:hypothetical protein